MLKSRNWLRIVDALKLRKLQMYDFRETFSKEYWNNEEVLNGYNPKIKLMFFKVNSFGSFGKKYN